MPPPTNQRVKRHPRKCQLLSGSQQTTDKPASSLVLNETNTVRRKIHLVQKSELTAEATETMKKKQRCMCWIWQSGPSLSSKEFQQLTSVLLIHLNTEKTTTLDTASASQGEITSALSLRTQTSEVYRDPDNIFCLEVKGAQNSTASSTTTVQSE